MTVVGYLGEKTSLEIDSSPWGIHYIDRDYPHDLLLDRLGQSGVKWTRLTARWSTIEVEKGRCDWSGLTEGEVLSLAKEPQQPSYDDVVSKLRWTY